MVFEKKDKNKKLKNCRALAQLHGIKRSSNRKECFYEKFLKDPYKQNQL